MTINKTSRGNSSAMHTGSAWLKESAKTNEAVAKIGCTKCDEISTKAAWQKNNNMCPKCKKSSTGVAETTNEGLGMIADEAERDHEVQMARAELYKIGKYSILLNRMLANVTEEEGLEGWQQAKITKAADYISSVYHALETDPKVMSPAPTPPQPMPSIMPGMSESQVVTYKQRLAVSQAKAQKKFMENRTSPK